MNNILQFRGEVQMKCSELCDYRKSLDSRLPDDVPDDTICLHCLLEEYLEASYGGNDDSDILEKCQLEIKTKRGVTT